MKKQLSFIIGLLVLILAQAHAVLTIEITQGVEGAAPIAIVPFAWAGNDAPPEYMNKIIAADLQRSGFFKALPEADMIATPSEAGKVNFADWRALKVDYVVVGKIIAQMDGSFQIQFQLLDVYKGKQLAGYSIRSRKPSLRITAHQISDIIYKTITGVRGAFDTHIAYITVTKNRKDQKLYRLAIADSDGFDEQIVYESTQPLLSPAWAPDGKRLAYVSFFGGSPKIYIQNILTRKTIKISDFKGINGAPSWSPDGRRMALTLSKDGNPEIYVVDLKTKKFTRVTHHYAIDTEAVWTPDGKALIFTSDRGGSPQLYRVELNRQSQATGRPKRLTFEGNYNARASISPDGRRLAMVHREQGKFHIAVLELKTGRFQILTKSRLDESPSFSPNGRMIIYATEDNYRGVLAEVSVDGRAHQRLSLQTGDVREPAWSPFK
ncbi:Tol-Pal system beta propeller repeat protein TolB [hydrothermal vent metagenome]|uniref:Tol-Pal system beta propeller repeat protein TolB n=1 Tax=hydrothermal vent metagenome TaxID=652676 RepID=A0A3B1BBP6_9ZZZZ